MLAWIVDLLCTFFPWADMYDRIEIGDPWLGVAGKGAIVRFYRGPGGPCITYPTRWI